jgi:MoaA/NifB/PqqE/SkfB family radical SAM enzyme
MKYFALKKIYSLYGLLKDCRDFPLHINLELTNDCNLSCCVCPRKNMQRRVSYLSKDLFLKVLAELSRYRGRSFWLHLFGEPLLHPELIWMVRLLKEKCHGSEVNLSTNCLLLDNDLSSRLLGSGLDKIRLCIDTINPDIYKEGRSNNNFITARDNIAAFLEIKRKATQRRPRAEIQFLDIGNDKNCLKGFIDYWKPFMSSGDKVHVQKFTTFANTVFAPDGHFRERKYPRSYFRKRLPCIRLWRDISIYCNGDATACCYDVNGELSIGNVNNSSIKDIWNSRNLCKIRDSHLKRDFRDLGPCSRCLADKKQ